MAERMTGGQAIVRTLTQKGIDTIFGLPGVHFPFAFALRPANPACPLRLPRFGLLSLHFRFACRVSAC